MSDESGEHVLAVVPPSLLTEQRGLTLFGTNDPSEVVDIAGKMAKPLRDVIEKQGLFSTISGRKHVRVEGWTLCGSMLGVFPVCVWTRQIADGWEARVEARLRDGSVVGAAEAQCTKTEATWNKRDDYAIRSMAQTRATSKALRLPLGFIVAMGGYDTTPAEEMIVERDAQRAAAAPPTVPAPVRRPPTAPTAAPQAPRSPQQGPIITEAQARRFYAIWKGAGKTPEQVQEYLGTMGLNTDREMPKAVYEVACAWAATKTEGPKALEGEIVGNAEDDYKGI